MTQSRPTDLEMQVLSVLWGRGASTVREVMEELPDGKTRAYTTVLTILQQMEKKRLVGHTRRGVTYVYRAKVKREDVVAPVVQTLLRNVFGGNASAVVQSLIDCTDVDEDQLKEIRRVINGAARKSREEEQ